MARYSGGCVMVKRVTKRRARSGFTPLTLLTNELTKRGIFWSKIDGFRLDERVAVGDCDVEYDANGITVRCNSYRGVSEVIPCTKASEFDVEKVLAAMSTVRGHFEAFVEKQRIEKAEREDFINRFRTALEASGHFKPGTWHDISQRVYIEVSPYYGPLTHVRVSLGSPSSYTAARYWIAKTPETTVAIVQRTLDFLDEMEAIEKLEPSPVAEQEVA